MNSPSVGQAVILCGGQGLRSRPDTAVTPKPLLSLAGRPLVAHVMQMFAHHGVTDFLLLAGYMAAKVAQAVGPLDAAWQVEVLDTGEQTDTGERLLEAVGQLDDTFFLSYCDCVANVSLRRLSEAHATGGWSVTLTTVPLRSHYGIVELEPNGAVSGFREKPVLPDHLISAGFMVVERSVLPNVSGPSVERDWLPKLANLGRVGVYRHTGFWASVDTLKDLQTLNDVYDKSGSQLTVDSELTSAPNGVLS